ncbi:MAG: hypothetical protein JZU64_02100 [Rhodoferax sp.]|nr:hypothetical protein [Rhodoferax sp.]
MKTDTFWVVVALPHRIAVQHLQKTQQQIRGILNLSGQYIDAMVLLNYEKQWRFDLETDHLPLAVKPEFTN